MKLSEVLVVEDNVGEVLLIRKALADCPVATHVRTALDGEQALQILREPNFKPDLIILDLKIPKLSGHSVLALRPQNACPVVVFTVSQDRTDAVRALQLGASAYVHKPNDLDEYRATICEMVRKWSGCSSNA
ncbi:MAG TPA: response regulator [Bryobacteraceae bacterium]